MFRTRPLCRVVIVLAIVAATACSAYRPVELPGPPPAAASIAAEVRAGDSIRVVLTDGREREFTVVAVEPDALIGRDGERVAYAEIVGLERRSIDRSRTTWLLLSPVLIFGAAFGVAVLIFAIGGP